MLPICFYVHFNLPECQASIHAAGTVKHAGSWISATVLQGWITAIATAVLAMFAIITAYYARKAFSDQSREVAILAEENERQALERRRSQASQVFVLAEPDIREGEPISSIEVTVKNTSRQPIYDLNLLWRDETGEWIELGDPVDLRVLLPDDQHKWGTGIEPSLPIQSFLGDPYLIGAAIIFRDAAGVHWRLDSDGQLDQEPGAGNATPDNTESPSSEIARHPRNTAPDDPAPPLPI
jgi:hypothetical protein